MEEILYQLIGRVSHDLQGFYTTQVVVGAGNFHQQVLLGFRSVYVLSIVVQVAVVPDLELVSSKIWRLIERQQKTLGDDILPSLYGD